MPQFGKARQFASLFLVQSLVQSLTQSGSERPLGITVIATLFVLAGVYLWFLALVRLFGLGAVSLMAGVWFMFGLVRAGPYMALIVGAGWMVVGLGLFLLQNWARWIAIGLTVLYIAALVPAISMARLGLPVFWYGLLIALVSAVGWYLAQSPAVIDSFRRKSSPRIRTDLHG